MSGGELRLPRTVIALWIGLLWILICPTGAQVTEGHKHGPGAGRPPPCSRPGSRAAKRIIVKLLEPRLSALGYDLPKGCRLNTTQDLYHIQEDHKTLMRRNVWRCEFDHKVTASWVYRHSSDVLHAPSKRSST
jgi:hypothetical protein